MFFRQTPQQRLTEWGDGNRKALRGLVSSGTRPGLVAYRNGTPAGWCSIAPRHEYSRLDRSPITKPVDDTLGAVSDDAAYHGVVTLLRAEQFEEVARRTPERPVMRRSLTG